MAGLYDIAQIIRQKRKELGLTQEEVARRAEVSRATVNRLETGNFNNVSFFIVARIAEAVRLELDLKEMPRLKTLNMIRREMEGVPFPGM